MVSKGWIKKIEKSSSVDEALSLIESEKVLKFIQASRSVDYLHKNAIAAAEEKLSKKYNRMQKKKHKAVEDKYKLISNYAKKHYWDKRIKKTSVKASRKDWLALAWDIFKTYVKVRDCTDLLTENSKLKFVWYCRDCWTRDPKQRHAWHIYPKGTWWSLYFEKWNVMLQCWACNYKQGTWNASEEFLNSSKAAFPSERKNFKSEDKSRVGLTTTELMDVCLKYCNLVRNEANTRWFDTSASMHLHIMCDLWEKKYETLFDKGK